MEIPIDHIHRQAFAELDTTQHMKNAAIQRDQRKYDDFLIIDVDAHHYENQSFRDIVEYIDDPVMRRTAQVYAGPTGRPSGSGLAPAQIGQQDVAGRVTRYALRGSEKTEGKGADRDVELSVKWMDAMGVDYACLFPTPMLSLGLHPQIEVETHLSKAYNRWLCERILANEPRLLSMIYLPFNDPEQTYETIKEFGDKKGVHGFMVTSVRYKQVYDNAYMKSYRLMEEMGKPLGFHAGFTWSDPLLGNTNRFLITHALGFTIFNVVHIANWIINGLPERFPKLKVLWIESGLAWVPWLMQRLDNDYKMRTSEAPALKKLPSEYMQDMYYSTQPMEIPHNLDVLEMTFKMIKADTQLMWASDFPHWDMDVPSTVYDLPFLNEKQKRNILGENARKFFDLDVSARFPDYKPL